MQFPGFVRYVLFALVVAMLGGLAGWYVFVQRHIDATKLSDDARGFGGATPFAPPLGSSFANQGGAFATEASAPERTTAGAAPQLWKVSAAPVAGARFASSSQLYFVERSSGNLLRATAASTSVERLTNTLFPKIYEALLSGSTAFLRTTAEDAVTTFAGTAGTSTPGTPAELKGVYLPQQIVAMAARGRAPEIFALIQNPDGGTLGVTMDKGGGGQKQVFASALSGWRAYYFDDGTIYLAQKATDGVPGFAFRLHSGALEPLTSSLPGLVVLPRSGSEALLYSTSQNGVLSLFVRASDDAAAVRLPLHTLAEKCAWAPGEQLIAYCAVPQTTPSGAFEYDWYRGIVHTSDSWWRVDASAGTAEEVFTPPGTLSLDAKAPVVDDSGAYLAFLNNADQSLWMLRLAQ